MVSETICTYLHYKIARNQEDETNAVLSTIIAHLSTREDKKSEFIKIRIPYAVSLMNNKLCSVSLQCLRDERLDVKMRFLSWKSGDYVHKVLVNCSGKNLVSCQMQYILRQK